jgi:3-deoxy-D-manno-octulosonate 8-phosphate phosphatase (KDO 8-P phosphatase)
MIQKLRTDLIVKLAPIRLLIINADGLLTEHQISYDFQNLSLSNGQGIKALRELYVECIAISTKKSEALSSIAKRIGIELLYQSVFQKEYLYTKLKFEHSVSDGEIAYIGGELSDLSIINQVSFPVAPADAALEVKTKSYYVTYGIGENAVREVVELILKAKNHFSGFSK